MSLRQKIGRAIFAIGIAGFFLSFLSGFYLESQVAKYPLQPDYTRGYVFSESAGRGEAQHYVPSHIHQLALLARYSFVAFIAFAGVGAYFKYRQPGPRIDSN
jgi:hypothetical protein